MYQWNGDFLPDIMLLTLCYDRWGTWLKICSVILYSSDYKRFESIPPNEAWLLRRLKIWVQIFISRRNSYSFCGTRGPFVVLLSRQKAISRLKGPAGIALSNLAGSASYNSV